MVHVVAVAFAAFSLRLSARPAAPKFLYGYERIAFFSAGFEGAMIVSAALAIIVTAAQKWLRGLQLENLGVGTFLLLAAGVLNAGLGWYLLKTGRRAHSLILQANGKHVLTDSWTSFGVVPGLLLVISPVTVSGPGSYIGLEAAAVDSSGSAIVIYSGYDTAGVHTEYGTNYQP